MTAWRCAIRSCATAREREEEREEEREGETDLNRGRGVLGGARAERLGQLARDVVGGVLGAIRRRWPGWGRSVCLFGGRACAEAHHHTTTGVKAADENTSPKGALDRQDTTTTAKRSHSHSLLRGLRGTSMTMADETRHPKGISRSTDKNLRSFRMRRDRRKRSMTRWSVRGTSMKMAESGSDLDIFSCPGLSP